MPGLVFQGAVAKELDHDYLWRCVKELPERGRIGIFNRCYYEEMLVVRVHPEILAGQKLPDDGDQAHLGRALSGHRAFERYLTRNGTIVLKFFLNVSKEEQKKRFLERIDRRRRTGSFPPPTRSRALLG